jgi:hypothetical protein
VCPEHNPSLLLLPCCHRPTGLPWPSCRSLRPPRLAGWLRVCWAWVPAPAGGRLHSRVLSSWQGPTWVDPWRHCATGWQKVSSSRLLKSVGLSLTVLNHLDAHSISDGT